MEIKNRTVSAAGNKQKKTSFLSTLKEKCKSIISTVNAKRKKIAMMVTTAMTMQMITAVNAFAASGTTPAGGDGEAMFNAVIGFFATWIGRIGLVVGFIGAIMFGLAIKNDDADAKTRGLMTMASGFVVFAITKALDLFGIT